MYSFVKRAREIIWATNWSMQRKKSVYGQIKGLTEPQIKEYLEKLGLTY